MRTFTWAFQDDPVFRYRRAGKKQTWISKAVQNMLLTWIIPLWIYWKICLTIEAGKSFIVLSPPPKTTWLGTTVDSLIMGIWKNLQRIGSSGQAKRQRELETKMKAAIARSLGNRTDAMFHVECLATEPAKQGCGYGSALLRQAITLAERERRSIWLSTDTKENVKFYNSHGFKTVDEAVLGNENPGWDEPPVVMSIMVREC
ncbi:hypothetical protein BD779DRAFT_397986 [Infundibulicybe gibba]|nr:hypothetical protein BD779DRAFT_397986 [Infundibulicybe gibba]